METEKTLAEVYKSPIKSIFEKFAKQRDVSLIFGETIDLENKRVLPVATVSYSVGGGGGFSSRGEESSIAQGEGGGGRIAINPIGVYEIKSDRVKFKPIIEFKFVLILVSIITFGVVWLLKKETGKQSVHPPLKIRS